MSRNACYLMLLLMVGCGDIDVTKLDRQLAELKAHAGGKEMALPQPPSYQVVTYNQAKARSPFSATSPQRHSASRESHSQTSPSPGRMREPLEAYPLDSLRLVGTLRIDGQRSALLRDPQGHVHRLQAGDYLGMDRGRITRVSEASLELVEIVSSPQGGWRERRRVISLNNVDQDSLDASSVD